jgi:hypothetical protein
MTDRADLIQRLEEAAKEQERIASVFRDAVMMATADTHMNVAALLREAAKALEGE